MQIKTCHNQAKCRCPLCKSEAMFFKCYRNLAYYRCQICQSVFMNPDQRLDASVEKSRYDNHENHVTDSGYQNFVQPVVDAVLHNHPNTSLGLDYGCGPGPVISFLLAKEGYTLNLYDPYYFKADENLEFTYDYIILSEVAEHFYEPYQEFSFLKSRLNPAASIYIKTSLWDDEMDFMEWSYKNDDTHVFFYSQESFQWIKDEFGFTQVDFSPDFIRLVL